MKAYTEQKIKPRKKLTRKLTKNIKQKNSKPIITCYTDGSYSPKNNTGGWSAYLECNGYSMVIYGGVSNTTISRMEITAVLQALKAVRIPSIFIIYSDSQYVVNSISKGWIQSWARRGWYTATGSKTANSDLWLEMLDLLRLHDVKISWIKGHSGNPGNELCDEFAQYSSRQQTLKK